MKCGSCQVETKHIEYHHIVPKSRGGSNKQSNLIKLCVDCHSKAHNVSFNGRSGLISESLSKKKLRMHVACNWFEMNGDKIHDFLFELYENDEILTYELAMSLIENNSKKLYELMEFYFKRRTTIKNITISL